MWKNYPVDDVVGVVAEAADEQRAGLRVERKLAQVHLAARLDRQPLRVRDPAVGGDPDEPDWAFMQIVFAGPL